MRLTFMSGGTQDTIFNFIAYKKNGMAMTGHSDSYSLVPSSQQYSSFDKQYTDLSLLSRMLEQGKDLGYNANLRLLLSPTAITNR